MSLSIFVANPIPMKARRLIFFILFALMATKLSAQLVNIESLRKTKDTARFHLNFNLGADLEKTNNNRLIEINTELLLLGTSKNKKNIYFFTAQNEYNNTNREEISNRVLLHLRYNRKLNSWLLLEAFSQYQYDKVLSIQARNLYGVGPRFAYIKKNFKAFFGSLYMLEYEQIRDEARTDYFDHRLSTYISLNVYFLKKAGKFSTITYYQPRLDYAGDYRISNVAELTYKLTKNIGLLSKVEYYFDSNPPPGIQTNNFELQNGLKLIF